MSEPEGWDEEKISERVQCASDAGLPGVRASEVVPQRVRWLWPGYFPQGAVIRVQGDPGKGKSILLSDLAACVTAPRAFPGSDRVPQSANAPQVICTKIVRSSLGSVTGRWGLMNS